MIGDRVLNSAVGYEALKKAIADARKKADALAPESLRHHVPLA